MPHPRHVIVSREAGGLLSADTDAGLFLIAEPLAQGPEAEDAAQLAAAVFEDAWMERGLPELEAYECDPGRDARARVDDAATRALQETASAVFDQGERRATRSARCGLTAVLLGRATAVVAHVGPASAWLRRGGATHSLSRPHHFEFDLHASQQDAPDRSGDGAPTVPDGGWLGDLPRVRTQVVVVDLLAGDRLLLATSRSAGQVDGPSVDHTDLKRAARAILGDPEGRAEAAVIEVGLWDREDRLQAPARALGDVPLFAALPLTARIRLGQLVDLVELAAGDVLMRRGDPGGALHVVVRGRLLVSRDGMALAELGPGSQVGEVSLVSETPRTADVTALEPTLVLAIGREPLLEFCRREPDLGLTVLWQLLGTVASRLRDTTTALTGGRPLGPPTAQDRP